MEWLLTPWALLEEIEEIKLKGVKINTENLIFPSRQI